MSQDKAGGSKLFYANTRAERLGRKPGGVARDVALTRAQAALDDIKPEFTVWLAHEFDALNGALAAVDTDPSNTAALERAFHSAAQLRDVSGTMGYELVTFIARTLCDILEAYIAGATYDRQVVECHANAFLMARMEQYRHLTPAHVPEMAQGLLRVVEIASIVPSKNGA